MLKPQKKILQSGKITAKPNDTVRKAKNEQGEVVNVEFPSDWDKAEFSRTTNWNDLRELALNYYGSEDGSLKFKKLSDEPTSKEGEEREEEIENILDNSQYTGAREKHRSMAVMVDDYPTVFASAATAIKVMDPSDDVQTILAHTKQGNKLYDACEGKGLGRFKDRYMKHQWRYATAAEIDVALANGAVRGGLNNRAVQK